MQHREVLQVNYASPPDSYPSVTIRSYISCTRIVGSTIYLSRFIEHVYGLQDSGQMATITPAFKRAVRIRDGFSLIRDHIMLGITEEKPSL